MDPLTLLRDYTTRNALDAVTLLPTGEYRFHGGGAPEYTFPANYEIPFLSKHSTRRYTLETLVHFITHRHLKHTEYMQHARSHRINHVVTLPDRKPLLDYLTGASDSIPTTIDQIIPPTSANMKAHHDPPEKRKSEEDPASDVDSIELIRAGERPIRDRESMLVFKKRDFYGVLTNAIKRDEERLKLESLQRKDNIVAKNRIESRGLGLGLGEEGKMMRKMGDGVPIILVPSAFSTLITIYNVKEFLEDGVFVPTDVKLKQMKGGKPECVTVQKKFSRDRVVAAYEVRDKPSALKSEDWDRVVAVFVLGKEWQFKDWPFKDHVEIFNKIVGFFIRFEDDSLESAKTVKQWNVKIISISKNKRHQDRAAALEVWDKLEEFMRSRSR